MVADKKGDDNMINKKEQPVVVNVTNEQVMKVAKEQFKKYRKTFSKLAKN